MRRTMILSVALSLAGLFALSGVASAQCYTPTSGVRFAAPFHYSGVSSTHYGTSYGTHYNATASYDPGYATAFTTKFYSVSPPVALVTPSPFVAVGDPGYSGYGHSDALALKQKVQALELAAERQRVEASIRAEYDRRDTERALRADLSRLKARDQARDRLPYSK